MHRMFQIALAAFVLVGSTAVAQAPSPVDVIKSRQAQFREVGTAFKAVNDELKKGTPGKFVLNSSAQQIASGLRQLKTSFPAGTGPSAGIKTKAKPDIWTSRATFDKLFAGSIVEADKLVAVLRGGDMKAVQAQAKALGGTRKSCHRQFRLEA